MTYWKAPVVACFSAGMVLLGTPGMASAAMIGTETLASQSLRADTEARVQTLLARSDVQAQLVSWGVDSERARARANAMSDAELQQVARVLDQQPAGGNALVIIGAVFLVLLILELVGITNVFSKF